MLHQLAGDAGHVLRDVHDRSLRRTLVAPALLTRADAGVRLASAKHWARQALQLAVGQMGMAAQLALVRRQRLQNA